MKRPYHYRGQLVPGVYQRCTDGECSVDGECSQHTWTYSIELPANQAGKRRQISKGGFETGRKAHDARKAIEQAHRDGRIADDMSMTVGEWLPKYLAEKVEMGELEASTVRTYGDHIRDYLVPKLGQYKLADLRPTHISRAYREIVADRSAEIEADRDHQARHVAEAEQINAARIAAGKRPVAIRRCNGHGAVKRPISPATVHRIHAVLSGALKAAVKAELIPFNVGANAKLPKAEKKKVKPPTPEQYGGLLDAISGERMYALILVAGHSGARRGELAAMRWSDIDLATGRWVVGLQRTSVGYEVAEKTVKTEAGEDRVIYLDAGTLTELKTWKAQQNRERLAWGPAYHDGGYVFTRENGRPLHPDAITKTVSRLMRRAGLTAAKLHALRHFRAAALISTGADISAVSRSMGHSSIQVTSDIYGSLFERANQEMSEKAAGIVPRQRRA